MKIFKLLLATVTAGTVLTSCGTSDNSKSDNEVIATLGEEKIYKEEIDKLIQPELYESIFNAYYARKLMTEQVISKKLLEEEAKSLKITVDSLRSKLKKENYSQANVDKYVEENALESGLPDPDHPGRVLLLNSAEGREALVTAFGNDVIYRHVEQLKEKKGSKIFLNPPLPPPIDLSKVEFTNLTSTKSKNTFWVFSDFTCSHCLEFYPTLRTLIEKNKSNVEFRYTALTAEPSDQQLFANFAARKNKSVEAIDLLFSKPFNAVQFCSDLRLDHAEFINFKSDTTNSQLIKSSFEKLAKFGKFEATPTIVINNRIYYGSLSVSVLQAYLDDYFHD